MKKTFLAISALAAMLFAGCTSSDELTTLESIKTAENTPTPVQFGTYMGRTGTRAGATGNIAATDDHTAEQVLAQKEGFGVFAYNTGASTWVTVGSTTTPNFMYNQQVTGTNVDSPVWSYTPVKYWPNGKDAANSAANPSNTATESGIQYLSFFAYAPYVALSGSALSATGITHINETNVEGSTGSDGNKKQGAPTIGYAFASNILTASNVDLLWGTRTTTSYTEADGSPSTLSGYQDAASNYYNIDLTKQNTTETVDFNFKHALTKIAGSAGLKIVADIDGNGDGDKGWGQKDATTLITVKTITIKNAENKIALSGTFNLATGDWTATNGTVAKGAKLNLDFNQAGGEGKIVLHTNIAEPASVPTWDGSAWSLAGVPAGNTAAALSSSAVAVDVYNTTGDAFYLIPGDEDQELEVVIDYIVRTYDAKLAKPSGESAACSKVEQTITNKVTLPKTVLAPNKYFTLVIHLGLTSVKFAASVSAWDSVGGTDSQDVWLPSNVVPAP